MLSICSSKPIKLLVTQTTATMVQTGNPITCLSNSKFRWVIDSGATDHMTGNSGILSSFQTSSPSHVTLANGSAASVVGSGSVDITSDISLTNVLCLPKFPFNLLSVSKITRAYNCGVFFFPGYCVFQDLLTKKIFGRGYESDGLYVLDEQISRPIATAATITPHQLHCRLGHPSLKSLQKLCPSLRSLPQLECESCQFAKQHRPSYVSRVNKRVASPFEVVHSDIWGPCPVVSKSGFRYFVTFVDDYSRVTWLYFMKNHLDLFEIFCAFHVEILNQFHTSIRNLRSDNAKEYFSTQFSSYLS